MIEYAIYALFGIAGTLVGFVLADSAVRFVNAWRTIRRQLEEIRNDL